MKKHSALTIRKLALLLAVVCLVMSLAACKNDFRDDDYEDEDEDERQETILQTDAPEVPDVTDAPVDPTEPTVLLGTVTHNNLNVRSNPSTDSTVLYQLNEGARVAIIETKVVGEVTWGRITDGWLNLNYVLIDGDEPEEPTEPVVTPDETDGIAGTITASELNIREKNNANARSVGKYHKGDKVVILETKDGWGRTDKGWISMKYVKTEGAAETPDLNDNQNTPDKDDNKDNNKDNNKNDKEMSTLVTDGKTKVLGYVEIDTAALYVRYGPGTKYNVASKVYDNERHAYYQEKNGWVRIKSGWISLAYTNRVDDDKEDEKDDKPAATIISDGNTTVLGYGVVTTTGLNVRVGPGTEHQSVDEVGVGDRVAYYQKDGKWIRTKDGWISTTYVYIEGTTGSGAGTGTVTGNQVNLRKGPGTGFDSNGKVSEGDKVDILATVKIGKYTWGYTAKGWIRMDYVDMN